MAARRGCVNSLWSGSERVRIGERLRATLAGVLELELLRCKHLELVDGALEERGAGGGEPRAGGSPESGEGGVAGESAATPRRQQVPSPSDMAALPCHGSPEDSCGPPGDGTGPAATGRGPNSRWSTLSWDAPSDLLSPPTPDPGGAVQLDSDSRPSSGFYSVSGSSLSDSSYSVSSDAALGGLVPPVKPLKLWEQVPVSADNTDILWSDGVVQEEQEQQPPQPPPPALITTSDNADPTEETPVPVLSDLDVTGLSFLTDLCSGLGQSLISSLLPILDPAASSANPSSEQRPQLDPRFCTDLVSRRTKEVYPYPSPLHAVALQSPLFTSQNQEQSASDGSQPDDLPEPAADLCPPLPPRQAAAAAPTSVTHLEQYIARLARQYHSRVSCSVSDLTSAGPPGPVSHRGLYAPGKGHGSTQSLSAFESRSATSALPGGGATPCKSLLGNSARISLSTNGKKATRNSINLGNLPSATGEDFNINLHLNLNLNLAPGLNSGRGTADNPKNSSCGALRGDVASGPAATSLSTSAPTPALRTRPRISTCPSTLSHRSSLEVAPTPAPSGGFGSAAFSRSLDWSGGGAQPEAPGATAFAANSGSAPGSQRSSYIQEAGPSPKLSEDSPMVGEISRLSGLSRAVVVGLMEQGVELDIDCFQGDTAGELRGHSKNHLSAQTDDYTRVIDLNPQRPIQLSLSVTHSPQSQSSLTPPLSHSSSPIHPYQSIHVPSANYSSHCLYQQVPSPSDLPSSTASSPASRPTQRGRSPPRPLQASPMGATPLSVFRRDAPFQCSLPRTNARSSPLEHGGIQPRGGSLRHSGGEGGGWKRAEGDGLYRGKHASHKLIRAATVSSYAHREDYSSGWGEEEQKGRSKRTPSKFCRGFEGRLWGKECESEREEADRAEYGYGWTRTGGGSWRTEHRRVKAAPGSHDRKPKVESSPVFSKRRGREDGERRSSSLRLSRRALFRSESQGLLVPRGHGEEPNKRAHWVSSLDVGHGGGGGGGKEEGLRLLRAKQDKRLSSTASLFNLSRSQSLEGSCHSLSPLSSPSFSPSPPPRAPLQRSRSLRDLGRKVFGSMRSLSLKRKPSKK